MATTIPPATIAPLQDAGKKMTWEEFERLPDGDGFHREILQGVLQVLPPPKLLHTLIAKRILRLLDSLELVVSDKSLPELGCKLSTNPASWVEPDVAFVRASRIQSSTDYFLGAPDLAVEVISPSESAKDVELKVGLMLAAGAQAIWVVYPETRSVHVFSPDGTSVRRGMGDKLTAPFLSTDWSVPVAALFANE